VEVSVIVTEMDSFNKAVQISVQLWHVRAPFLFLSSKYGPEQNGATELIHKVPLVAKLSGAWENHNWYEKKRRYSGLGTMQNLFSML
jgi:hypothetical protein